MLYMFQRVRPPITIVCCYSCNFIDVFSVRATVARCIYVSMAAAVTIARPTRTILCVSPPFDLHSQVFKRRRAASGTVEFFRVSHYPEHTCPPPTTLPLFSYRQTPAALIACAHNPNLSTPPCSNRFVFLQRWEGGIRHKVTVGETKGGAAEVEFVCGDFTVLDWSDGELTHLTPFFISRWLMCLRGWQFRKLFLAVTNFHEKIPKNVLVERLLSPSAFLRVKHEMLEPAPLNHKVNLFPDDRSSFHVVCL